jgi:hypothetical protein
MAKVTPKATRHSLTLHLQQHISNGVSSITCGLARLRSLVGEKPPQVAVSHGPGIESCTRNIEGSIMLDSRCRLFREAAESNLPNSIFGNYFN